MEYSGADTVAEYSLYMMPGAKGLNPHELACKWMKDLGTRPYMSMEGERKLHDMRMEGRIVGVRSTKQSAGIKKTSIRHQKTSI